jgi:hypothetical protein
MTLGETLGPRFAGTGGSTLSDLIEFCRHRSAMMKIKKPRLNCRGFSFSLNVTKTHYATKVFAAEILATKISLVHCSSQLPVLSQHRAALAAHAPAMSRERCAAAQQIAPGHAAGTVAQPRRGRPAWRKLGKIDGLGGGARKCKKRPNQ